MKKLWTRSLLILTAAAWFFGPSPVSDTSRLYAAEKAVPQAPVNVNTASTAELQAIPGIGPALAQRIIDYRSQFGNFERIDDLLNVSGIGPVKFDTMKTQITT